MFFRKKKEEEEKLDENTDSEPQKKQEQASDNLGSGSSSSVVADIVRLKAQFESFAEIRKVTNERFTRLNEQIGELRGMIMDLNRSLQEVEVKTVKAVDLVEAVQPDKLMVEVRKEDSKVEALRANLESNENLMKTVMNELRDLRKQMSVFKGLEQVIKLSDDIKNESTNILKIKGTIDRHSDKIESIFVESQKRFGQFEEATEKINDLNKQLKQLSQDLDATRVKIPTLATRKEVEDLIAKFNDFEKHVGNVIDLLTRRSNDLPSEINERFAVLEGSIKKAFETKMEKADKVIKMFEDLERRAPMLSEKLNLEKLAAEEEQISSMKTQKAEVSDEKKDAKDMAEVKQEAKEDADKKKKGFFGFGRKK
jgi:chromosome segregation ATPase